MCLNVPDAVVVQVEPVNQRRVAVRALRVTQAADDVNVLVPAALFIFQVRRRMEVGWREDVIRIAVDLDVGWIRPGRRCSRLEILLYFLLSIFSQYSFGVIPLFSQNFFVLSSQYLFSASDLSSSEPASASASTSTSASAPASVGPVSCPASSGRFTRTTTSL